MPLITSTTNLNKLKFGIGNAGDRFDNGSSNQPYITTPIPGVNMDNSNPTPITELDSSGAPIYGDVTPGSLDILFRGGLNAVTDSITDVSRLTKMFFDTKSPNGLIFIGNQNLLSRTSVMTEASYGWGYGRNKEPNFITGKGGGALPGGIYLPSSTLAQAAVNFTGTHLNLMGIDPTSPSGVTGNSSGISGLFGDGPGLGLRTYSMAMADKLQVDEDVPDAGGNQLPLLNLEVGGGGAVSALTGLNRLVRIFDSKQNVVKNDPDVIVYNGGPGSILGIGKTRIRFAGSNGTGNTRTGLNNALAISNPLYFNGTDPTYAQKFQFTTTPNGELAYGGEFGDDLSGKLGLSNNIILDDDIGEEVFLMNMLSATYTLGSSFEGGDGSDARGVYTNVGLGRHNSPNTVVFNANQLNSAQFTSPTPGNAPIGPDFRKLLIDTTGEGGEPITKSNILSISPEYTLKNLNNRTNFGDPGANGPKTKTGESGRLKYGVKASEMIAIDKINAQIMYSGSVAQDTTIAKNDLVKFRIAAIDNNSPSQALYMHFRAFIDSFSDSYTADWQGFKYSGRGENLYHYNGFDRQISLGFTVYAQSKAELIPMYKKLNYLASTLAPDYTAAGFMRGNIVRLTLGGYLYEQPGFISGMTFEAPQESSWEIAINEEGSSDSSVKELPFMIKVTGMSFTPIHEFLPSKIRSDSANGMTPDGVMIDERYIALDNGFTENYTNAQGEYRAQKSTNTGASNNIADVNIEQA
mgnify:CR=1 FL=1